MIQDLFWVLLGLVMLAFAGDFLVKGAVNLALRLGIPGIVVGLTVVAFGTSAPELLVSIKAVMDDVPSLALGNVVGSNIANVLLVLGVPALIAVLRTSQCDTKQSYITMMVGTILFTGLAFWGAFTWVSGIALLTMLGYMLWQSYAQAMRHRRAVKAAESDDDDLEEADPSMPNWKIAAYLIAGIIGLQLGAEFLVTSAVNIAQGLGVSETVIGLTLVAFGTSVPELATTVMAAIRRSADVALGNVIGSNMFNLLAIIGITSLVGTVPVPPSVLAFDIWIMIGAALLLIPFVMMGRDIGFRTGLLFLGAYVAYLVTLVAWGGAHG